MDQKPHLNRPVSAKAWLVRFLNIIMILALVLLGATALQWLEGVNTERAYAVLASQRPMDSAAVSEPTSPNRSSDWTEEILTYPRAVKIEPIGSFEPNPNTPWLAINPDFAGWIRIAGTRIDYPYVRGNDNEEYLKTDFYGKPAKAGTVFLDYRNLGGPGETHTMLYGHNMKNGTMFHDLVKYHDADFLRENPLITLTDLYGERTYRIFSVYEVSADDYALPLEFAGPQDYSKFLQDLSIRSMHEIGSVTAEATLLSLITCSYGVNNGRTIVHALAVGPG